MNRTHKLVEVYKTANQTEAEVIKGKLEAYGVPSFLRSSVGPSPYGITASGLLGGIKVMVPDTMADRAREIITSDKDV